jgi:hypothetical protein
MDESAPVLFQFVLMMHIWPFADCLLSKINSASKMLQSLTAHINLAVVRLEEVYRILKNIGFPFFQILWLKLQKFQIN